MDKKRQHIYSRRSTPTNTGGGAPHNEQPGPSPGPPKKEGARKRKWSVRRKIITFGSIGLVCCLIFATVFFYFDKLGKINYVATTDRGVDTSLQIPVEEDDIAAGDLEQAEKIEYPEGSAFHDQDIVNLLLGTDELTKELSDNARADAIMILSLNKRTDEIKLVSLQRAIGVPIPGRPDDWLTHSFAYGGGNLTLEIVEKCFLIELSGFIRVNFVVFQSIIDLIGGVDIELTALEAQALNNEVYTNAVTHAYVTAGVNHLDGYDALQYARLRFIDDDWHRIQRQRTVMISALNGIRDMDILTLNSLADEILPMVQTSLDMMEITGLLLSMPQFLNSEVEQMSLPAQGTFTSKVSEEGRNLNVVDFEENSRILHEFLGV